MPASEPSLPGGTSTRHISESEASGGLSIAPLTAMVTRSSSGSANGVTSLNNRIEQDHRANKRRVRPMLGFKSADSARVILNGIELIHMMRKHQAKYACNQQLSLAEQFERLAA
jgi:transposase-like protein